MIQQLFRFSSPFFFAVAFAAAGGALASESASSMTTYNFDFPSEFSRADFDELLHPGHPRLFATTSQWEKIRHSLETSQHLQQAVAALADAAAQIERAPVQKRIMTGRRLLHVSREVLRRTLVLGVLYRLTEEERYFERARAELLGAAAFADWNPSHFLDTAEMTLALAVGYDWFHERLTEEDRTTLRLAILEKGLRPGLGPHRWKERDNNWNQVCFAGMVAGALAIGDHEPELGVTFLRETFANIHRPLQANLPHGAYPEGPTYWSYGTHFQVILLSVLESALGKTWGLESFPAFQESAVYINLMIGPSGNFFNYADANASVAPLPALHWFASRATNATLDAGERERLLIASAQSSLGRLARQQRLFALSLLWFDPTLGDTEPTALPLHWRADGPNPVAIHRSSWSPDSFYLGIKGGSADVNHGHMDVGTFVLDWRGLRWAVDLGMQNYESLEFLGLNIWNRAQQSDRWRVFRLNSYSHNTLVVDDQLQIAHGFAPIIGFSDNPEAPFTVVDMTAAYAGSLSRALRGARLLGGERVLIHDEVAGLAPGQTIRWGMVTPAVIETRGNLAILRLNEETLHAHILSPTSASFREVPTDPPPNDFDAANPGSRMLAFSVNGNGEPQDIRVVFSAQPPSADEIHHILSQPGPSEWRPD